jgi:hypothetical protein
MNIRNEKFNFPRWPLLNRVLCVCVLSRTYVCIVDVLSFFSRDGGDVPRHEAMLRSSGPAGPRTAENRRSSVPRDSAFWDSSSSAQLCGQP